MHSYEPHPDFYQFLSDNISLNGNGESVTTYNEAVSGEDGQVTLKISDSEFCPSLNWEDGEEVEVDGVRLETAVGRLDADTGSGGGRKLLKLDVEGAEFDILENADTETLQFFDEIAMEWHEWGGELEEIVGIIEDAGFEVEIVDGEQVEEGTALIHATHLTG